MNMFIDQSDNHLTYFTYLNLQPSAFNLQAEIISPFFFKTKEKYLRKFSSSLVWLSEIVKSPNNQLSIRHRGDKMKRGIINEII